MGLKYIMVNPNNERWSHEERPLAMLIIGDNENHIKIDMLPKAVLSSFLVTMLVKMDAVSRSDLAKRRPGRTKVCMMLLLIQYSRPSWSL